jgi:uncharacterized protein
MNKGQVFMLRLLLIICVVFTVCSTAFAGSLEEIKQNMIDRAPVIKSLKLKGIIGEDNHGYLAFVGSARTQEALIAAENADRKVVYAYFAQNKNTSLTVVETVQGKRKAGEADAGEFIQNPDGSWHKK